ncbi:unnamed protein product, partial [Mesorhabditis belari]|uniref:TATA element modulatory factor 1 TATA binding domain-containing protein n=1 Tax=Mesorhabditis belari TaxID=2138241 RepID=A0AAF3J6I6_9BILA
MSSWTVTGLASRFQKGLEATRTKIDNLLDIHEEEGAGAAGTSNELIVDADGNIIQAPQIEKKVETLQPQAVPPPESSKQLTDWEVSTELQPVVDSEPNPIRDSEPNPSFPRSVDEPKKRGKARRKKKKGKQKKVQASEEHSPAEMETLDVQPLMVEVPLDEPHEFDEEPTPKQEEPSPTRTAEELLSDQSSIHAEEHASTTSPEIISEDLGKPGHEASDSAGSGPSPPNWEYSPEHTARRNSDENLTTVSSDIEVVPNSDVWSISTCEPGALPESIPRLLRDQIDEKRFEDLKKLINTLNEEKQRLKQQNMSMSEERIKLAKQLSVCEQEKKDIIQEGNKFSEEILKLRNELRKLKEKCNTAESKTTQLSGDSRKYREKLDAALEQLDETEKTVETQKEELSHYKKHVTELEEKLNKQADETSRVRTQQAATLSEAHNVAANELARNREQIQNLSLEYERCRNMYEAMVVERDEFRSRYEVTKVEAQKASSMKESSSVFDEAALLALRERCSQLEGENHDLTQKLYNHENTKDDLLERLKSDLSSKERKVAELTATLNIERERSESRFQQARDCNTCKQHAVDDASQRRYIEELNSHLKNMREMLEQEQTEKASLADRVVQLTVQVREFQAANHLSDTEKTEIRELKRSVDEETRKRRDIERKYDELLRLNGELLERESELREDIKDLKVAIRTLAEDQVSGTSNSGKGSIYQQA